MSKRKKTGSDTRLIVAASEHDPDMLYATRFFAPDAFIFLEERGKRTLVLSDLRGVEPKTVSFHYDGGLEAFVLDSDMASPRPAEPSV